MPVRSLTQSVLRWPETEQVMRQVEAWADQQGERVISLDGVEFFGSYSRGHAGVGSDLDLLLIDAHTPWSPVPATAQLASGTAPPEL
jgi:predicted nucleotidyltransferase